MPHMKKKMLFSLVTLLLSLVSTFTLTSTTFAASSRQQASNSQVYNIGFIDTHTGKISYWTTSSYVQWQQRIQQERHLPGISTSAASPDIVRVNGCSSGQNQYYDLMNIPAGGNVPVCFAQSGDTGRINVYCVHEIWTGNNTGYVLWDNRVGNTGKYPTPQKNTPYFIAGDGTHGCPNSTLSDVTDVHIN